MANRSGRHGGLCAAQRVMKTVMLQSAATVFWLIPSWRNQATKIQNEAGNKEMRMPRLLRHCCTIIPDEADGS